MTSTAETTDILVVGAGFAGIYMSHAARKLGLSVIAVDRAGGFGGTWYWNRYPGLRCDVESIDYSFSFDNDIQQNWSWSEKFASQPEILRYAEFVADRLELRPLFRFGNGVKRSIWNEDETCWYTTLDDDSVIRSRYVAWATGILSEPKKPAIDGIDSFAGETLYTARWPHEGFNFEGKRVAVIGTGSSGLGVIPEIAKQAEHLYVIQRTPSYSVPGFNKPIAKEQMDAVKADYPEYRKRARPWPLGVDTLSSFKTLEEFGVEAATEELRKHYDYGNGMRYGGAIADVMVNMEANEFASQFLRDRIRERVGDDELAEKLIPKYPMLTRRLCVDHGYFETFRRDNVTLIDQSEQALERIDARGFQTSQGHYDVDVIVCATGFDALTGALVKIDIEGSNGLKLAEKWNEAPSAYLGIGVAGFPNTWMINAPTSPSAFSNVVLAIEQQVEWISRMLQYLQENNIDRFEPEADAEQKWVEHVDELTRGTLMVHSKAWYSGANIPGKPRIQMVYLGGLGPYEETLNDVAADNYRGFALTQRPLQ